MHATLLAFAWTAFFVCYLPVVLRLNFDNKEIVEGDQTHAPNLKMAVSSTLFKYSLVASVASAVPMVIELTADTFTTGFRIVALNHYAVISKWILLSAMIVPNLIILIIVIPNENYVLMPSILQSRQIILFYALMTFMGLYGNPIWTPSKVRFLVVLFSLGEILECFLAFSFFVDIKYLQAIQLAVALTSSLFLVYLAMSWCYHIATKIFVDKVAISVDEYYCNVHLFSLLIAFFGEWALVISYFNIFWAGRNDVYLILVTYCEVVYTVVLGIWNGRISRREFAIMQTKQELETKRMLVRYLSHEIRTPLNTVMMGLKLLQIELTALAAGDDVRDIVRDLTTSCDSAVEILNDMLIYEKLSANILTLDMSSFSTKIFVHQVVHPFFLQAREAGIHLIIRFHGLLSQDNVDMILKADKSKLAQVVRNLVSNALKFSKRDGTVVLELTSLLPGEEKVRRFSRRIAIENGSAQHSAQCSSQRMRARISSVHDEVDLEDARWIEDNDSIRRSNAHSIRDRSVVVARMKSDDPQEVELGTPSPGLCPPVNSRDRLWGGERSSGRAVGLERIAPYQHRIAVCDDTYQPPSRRSAAGGTPLLAHLRIDVTDSGPGVSKEDQKRLFKEIVQFNPGALQDGKGSGLGLWISGRIMDLHSGSLTMTSEGLGCGCTFTMELPNQELATVSSPAAEKDDGDENDADVTQHSIHVPAVRNSSISSARDTSPNDIQQTIVGSNKATHISVPMLNGRLDLQQSRILLVDDAPLNRKFLRRLLAPKCVSIVEAEDGKHALNLVLASLAELSPKIDLVIIDYQMPVMNGPDAVRHMRDAGYSGVVLGLTGNALPSDIQVFMSHGADRVLIKPLSMDDLESALEEISQ